jgi:hypothetical protein
MRIQNDALWTNQAMGVATITTAPQPLDHIYGFAIQVVWTGTPVGNFSLEASCDAPTDGTLPVNWGTLPSSSIPAGGAAGAQIYNVSESFYKWIRIKYVGSGSSGTVNARVNIKGV